MTPRSCQVLLESLRLGVGNCLSWQAKAASHVLTPSEATITCAITYANTYQTRITHESSLGIFEFDDAVEGRLFTDLEGETK